MAGPRFSLLLVVVAVAFAGTAAAAAADASAPSSSTAPAAASAAPPTIAAPAVPSYGSFLECLTQAPDAFSIVRSQLPRYLTNATAWANPDVDMTLFVPSDAALVKFWSLGVDEMRRFPVENFRSAFTPFVRYSMLPKALAPQDMAVGASEPTAFRRPAGNEAGGKGTPAAAAALRFVPGKAGGSDVAVRARYSLAPLTGDHWQCGKGWAHGVGSVLLF